MVLSVKGNVISATYSPDELVLTVRLSGASEREFLAMVRESLEPIPVVITTDADRTP